jgi:hypothetical protein
VTPSKIEAARGAAVAALNAAYAPQPIAQPDGSTLHLCWHGRIARGYERLAAARRAKDAAAVATITAAIRGLEAQANDALATAERAASDWAAMAAAAGSAADPQSVYPGACTCVGCKAAAAHHDHNEARGRYSDALYRLLAPTSGDCPLLDIIAACDTETGRDKMWAALRTIYSAGRAYEAACKAADVPPNWRAALYPGEE